MSKKSYEFSAKTIEEAISLGLEELGVAISDVTVDIIQEGSKGLFGLFGSRLAKVKLTLNDDEEEAALAKEIVTQMMHDDEKPEEPSEVKAEACCREKACRKEACGKEACCREKAPAGKEEC